MLIHQKELPEADQNKKLIALLERQEDAAEKRRQCTHEETMYRMLVERERAQQQPSAASLTLQGLLEKKNIRVDAAILRRIIQRFSIRASLAVLEQDAEAASDVYAQTLLLPNTETTSALEIGGLAINGSLLMGSNSLQIAFEGSAPRGLKNLREDESTRAKELARGFEGALDLRTEAPECFCHITVFRLLQERGKCFMLMPLFPTTVEHIPRLDEATARKLLLQVSSALDALHERGFSHMDVKPSNICITQGGDFVLADLGSVERFGRVLQSTTAYVPGDVSAIKTRALVDWWMLAVTVCEKLFQLQVGICARQSKAEVMALLRPSEAMSGLVRRLEEADDV